MNIRITNVELVENDGPTTLIEVSTDAETIHILGECEPFDRHLVLSGAHIQDLQAGPWVAKG